MAGSTTTTTTAVFNPEKWSAKTLLAVEENLVMANLVDRYDVDVKQEGDVVHIPNLANVTAEDISSAQGDAIAFTNNTETENTITLNQYFAAGVRIPSIVEVQSQNDLMGKYTKKIGYALAEKIDATLTALQSGLSQEVDAGTAVSVAEVVSGIQLLDLANAPATERAFVVDPRTMGQLRQLAEFTRYDATGMDGIPAGGNNGLVGNVYNIPVYMTTNIVTTAGTPNVVNNLLFHKEAFGLALQKAPTMESERNVERVSDDLVGHAIWGVSELRDAFGVRFEFDY